MMRRMWSLRKSSSMIDKRELRIGNWVCLKSTGRPVKIEGINSNGTVEISTSLKEEIVEPLYLTDTLLKSLESNFIIRQYNDRYYFSGLTKTYFLVKADEGFFMGMIHKGL